MMEPTKDWLCNNISKPLDRACVGRVLPERNMSSQQRHQRVRTGVRALSGPKTTEKPEDLAEGVAD